jgi:hypothetical protein
MTIRTRLRPALLASALGLAPLVGCIGASDDKLGSGNTSTAGGSGIDEGAPIGGKTQQTRQDSGDAPSFGDQNGTARPNDSNATRTGGMGGVRDNKPPAPGETGTKASAGVASGPK